MVLGEGAYLRLLGNIRSRSSRPMHLSEWLNGVAYFEKFGLYSAIAITPVLWDIVQYARKIKGCDLVWHLVRSDTFHIIAKSVSLILYSYLVSFRVTPVDQHTSEHQTLWLESHRGDTVAHNRTTQESTPMSLTITVGSPPTPICNLCVVCICICKSYMMLKIYEWI